jgi:hypothetical protein
MLKYTNGKAVERGDVVHLNNNAYTVHDFDKKSGYVYVKAMTEGAYFKPIFPSQIKAYWDNVHPIFAEALKCFP